jgi:hypothetical protein
VVTFCVLVAAYPLEGGPFAAETNHLIHLLLNRRLLGHGDVFTFEHLRWCSCDGYCAWYELESNVLRPIIFYDHLLRRVRGHYFPSRAGFGSQGDAESSAVTIGLAVRFIKSGLLHG